MSSIESEADDLFESSDCETDAMNINDVDSDIDGNDSLYVEWSRHPPEYHLESAAKLLLSQLRQDFYSPSVQQQLDGVEEAFEPYGLYL